jgi:integrase
MKGIRETGRGYQVFVRVKGRFYSKRFPKSATLTEMKTWRENTRVQIRTGQSVSRPDSTLAEDVRLYLELVRSMPSFRDRKDDLDRWVRVLGRDRDRKALTALDIGAQLEQWRQDGYAPNTVNHRRTALMSLFTRLDGKSARNPARDVPRYQPDDRSPRGMPPLVVLTILEHMPSSQTKARLGVMTWTGWPQMTLERLEPGDIRWHARVYVKRRRKGRGVVGEWLPLLPDAWTALRQFKRLGCWGTFSRDSMRQCWQRAVTRTLKDTRVSKEVKASIVTNPTPYDLRHSFGTLVALVTRDNTVVQKLLRHSDPRQTALYMAAAEDVRVSQGLWKVAKQLPGLTNRKKRSRKAA